MTTSRPNLRPPGIAALVACVCFLCGAQLFAQPAGGEPPPYPWALSAAAEDTLQRVAAAKVTVQWTEVPAPAAIEEVARQVGLAIRWHLSRGVVYVFSGS